MSKTYRPYEPNQMFLLPPSLQDWLPPDHMVHVVGDVIDAMDLSAITSVYEAEERGYPPYHPKVMVLPPHVSWPGIARKISVSEFLRLITSLIFVPSVSFAGGTSACCIICLLKF